MKEGKITKVIEEKKFFFIDRDYWCHFNQYNDRNPEVGDEVEYEPEEKPDGKKNAVNARLIMKTQNQENQTKSATTPISNDLNDYYEELRKGYFDSNGNLKEDLIIKYPQKLAKIFTKDNSKNKSAQISKFYYEIKKYESIYKLKRNFGYLKSELFKIIPLAEKSEERNHISSDFKNFLSENINMAVQNSENFSEGFIPHLQSLMGYFKN